MTAREPHGVPSTVRSRIDWSEAEEARFTEALRKELPDAVSPADALKKAMLVLPESRRRPVHASTAYKRFLVKARQQPKEPEVAVVPGKTLVVEVEKSTPTTELLARVPASLLLATCLARLFRWVVETETAWRLTTGKPVNPTVTRTAAPTYPEPPRKDEPPRVVVVGLLASQNQHVLDKTRNVRAAVTFLDKDLSNPDFPAKTDYVIVEKHVSHYWWESAKRVLPADRVKFATGITDVVQKIYDIASLHGAAR